MSSVYKCAEVVTSHGLPISHATSWMGLVYTWHLSDGTRGITFNRDKAVKIAFDYGEEYDRLTT